MVNLTLHRITNKTSFDYTSDSGIAYMEVLNDGQYSGDYAVTDPDVLHGMQLLNLYADGTFQPFMLTGYLSLMYVYPEYERRLGDGWDQKTYIPGLFPITDGEGKLLEKGVDALDIDAAVEKVKSDMQFLKLMQRNDILYFFKTADSNAEKLAVALTGLALSNKEYIQA